LPESAVRQRESLHGSVELNLTTPGHKRLAHFSKLHRNQQHPYLGNEDSQSRNLPAWRTLHTERRYIQPLLLHLEHQSAAQIHLGTSSARPVPGKGFRI